MKKKLQIFVSSTYLDLQLERQAAVQAILDAGHIPAGMELFRAGNDSQLKTIKKWIDNSDAYMLILGGRYGSIDEAIGKSYTQIEYEYALKKNMPIFAVVLSDSFLHLKASKDPEVLKDINIEHYKTFKSVVMSKVVKIVNDEKDIMLAIHGTLSDFIDEFDLVGWIRDSKTDEVTTLLKENSSLNKEITSLSKEKSQLLKQINVLQDKLNKTSINSKNLLEDYSFDELIDIFSKKEFVLPAEKYENDYDMSLNALDLFINTHSALSTGLTNGVGNSKSRSHLFYNIAPFFMSYGICEKVKVAGVQWERIQLSKIGLRFYARLESEGYTKEIEKAKITGRKKKN